MPKGVYAAASAMLQEQRSMNAVAENMANVQSHGFRRVFAQRQGFAEVLADHHQRRGDIDADGGAGVTRDGLYRTFSAASLQKTDRPLDVAISRDRGFFALRRDDGEMVLSRNGSFTLDDNGRLVNQEGWQVEGQGGAIVIPADYAGVTIDGRGRVYGETAEGGFEFIEQLRVADVADHQRLEPISGQHFLPGGQALEDVDGDLQQGFLEGSNVNAMEELVRMVAVQRRYDAAQRALTRQLRLDGMSDILRGVG